MGFGKLFWLGCNSVVNFFQVWMYEYFGVGPQVREEVDGIYPRFLHWLPKYCLSMPSRHSLEIWRMLIDNLTIAYVSFSLFVRGLRGLLWFGLLLILGFFVIFRCL